jgi:multidrug efflux pump
LSIGTLFTLMVVPAVYILIGADHGHDKRAATLTVAATPGSRDPEPAPG